MQDVAWIAWYVAQASLESGHPVMGPTTEPVKLTVPGTEKKPCPVPTANSDELVINIDTY